MYAPLLFFLYPFSLVSISRATFTIIELLGARCVSDTNERFGPVQYFQQQKTATQHQQPTYNIQ